MEDTAGRERSMGIMKKNKVWLIAVVFGLVVITTVYYLAALRNTRTEYANGRIVERTYEEEPDVGIAAFSFSHGKLNLTD